RLSQLRALLGSNQRAFCRVDLQATVLFSDAKRHLLALRDDSGIAIIDSDEVGPSWREGDRIAIRGNCGVEGSSIKLGRVPVVDNDGQHSRKEKSGTIFLRA